MFIRTFFFYTAKKLLFISSLAKNVEILGTECGIFYIITTIVNNLTVQTNISTMTTRQIVIVDISTSLLQHGACKII